MIFSVFVFPLHDYGSNIFFMLSKGAVMTLELPRWRYIYDGQNPPKVARETDTSKEDALRSGHIAYSVHTFGAQYPPPPLSQAWGDIHLTWEDSTPGFHARRIQYAKRQIQRFLDHHAIPREQIEYYISIYGVRIVVPASLFGGESGGQYRITNEVKITKRYHCTAAPNSKQTIHRRNLPFVPRDGLCSPGPHPQGHKQVASKAFWDNDPNHFFDLFLEDKNPINFVFFQPHPDAIVTPQLSCLARVFTQPDSHRVDHILECSVLWQGLQYIEHISHLELTLLVQILGNNKAARHFLATKGRKLNRPDHTIQRRLDGINPTSEHKRFPFCAEIREQLEATSLLTCKSSCGVTTPVALQYKTIPWHAGPFNTPLDSDNFECASTGVYLKDNARQPKELLLPRPVWASAVSRGGGMKISLVDMGGQERETIITQADLDSHLVFQRLEDNGLILPPAPKQRHVVRTYIKSLFRNYRYLEKRFHLIPSPGWNLLEGKHVYVSSGGKETFPQVRIPVKLSIGTVPPLFSFSPNPIPLNRLCDLLIVSLEIMAMVLKPMGFDQGVCCHFFDPTAEVPETANNSFSRMVFKEGHTPEQAHGHLAEMVKLGTDGVVRLIASNEDETPLLRRLIGRFLLGRKNGTAAMRGIVLSSGKESFTSASGIITEYFHGQKLLAICVAVSPHLLESVPLNIPCAYRANAITALTNDIPTAVHRVRELYEHYIQQAKSPKATWGKGAAAFFALAAAVADWSREQQVIQWYAPNMPGKMLIHFFLYWYRVAPDFDTYLEQLLTTLHYGTHQEAKEIFVLSPENPKLLLVTSSCLKRLIPSAVHRNTFVGWLAKNKILRRDTQKHMTAVHHVPEINKACRGYLLRIDAAKKLLERPRPSAYGFDM